MITLQQQDRVEPSHHKARLLLIALASTSLANPVFAATESAVVSDEIVITAANDQLQLKSASNAGSRLNLTPLETPASVSVIEGAQIRLRGDTTINAAVSRAVGITTTATVGGAGNGVAVRGFNGSSIAYIYDGIRNMAGLGNLAYPYDPWTVDRVEVLNGPASVLYGNGGIGGSINIVPRRPSDTAEFNARLSAGSFNTFREAIDATGPISDKLLYRLDVSQQNSDGYIRRGKSSSTAVSGALTFLPTENLRVTLSDDYGRIRPMNYNGLPLVNGVALRSLRKVNYATDDVNVRFIENTTRIDINWAPAENLSIRNISSYVYGDRIWRQGPTQLNYQPASNTILRGSYGEYLQKQRQWNNQTEVLWKHQLFGMDNSLSLGGDLEHLYFRRIVNTYAGTSVVSRTNPVPGIYPAVAPAASGGIARVNRFSLFADDRLSITPQLSLVAGIRYDRQDTKRDDLFVTPARAQRVFKPVSYRAGAVYDILPSFTAYVQYSKSTDPISNVCCVSAVQLGYDAAKGNQIEAGLKQSTWHDRLTWTLAFYRIRKTKLLIPDPITPARLIQVGGQSSKGIEASAALKLVEGLQAEANGTVLKAKYDNFVELVSGALLSRNGNRPTNVPVKSANLWLTWDATSKLKAQAGLRYVGNRFIDTANTITTPSYTVIDTSIRYLITDRIALDVRGFNLTNKLYATTFISNGRGGGQWQLGAPRSFEVAVTAQF